MKRQVSNLLAAEAIAYVVAALVHAGVILPGYEHSSALIAESSLAAVLGSGFVVSRSRPSLTRDAGLWAQGLALFWTMVGLLTIILGVGPRTLPDVIYHVLIVSLLFWGLLLARRVDGPEGG